MITGWLRKQTGSPKGVEGLGRDSRPSAAKLSRVYLKRSGVHSFSANLARLLEGSEWWNPRRMEKRPTN